MCNKTSQQEAEITSTETADSFETKPVSIEYTICKACAFTRVIALNYLATKSETCSPMPRTQRPPVFGAKQRNKNTNAFFRNASAPPAGAAHLSCKI